MTAALPAIATPSLEITPTGLVTHGAPTFDDYRAMYHRLREAHTALLWCLADWSAQAEAQFGERYYQLVEATGFDQHYLSNLATVARAFPNRSLRSEELTFSHYRELAARWIPPDRRAVLLDAAVSAVATRDLKDAKRALWQDMYPDVPYTAANARKAANGEPLHPDTWRGDTGPRTTQEARTMVYFGALAPDDTQVIEVTGALDAAPPVAQPLLTVLPKTYAFTAKAYRTNGDVVLEPCNPPLPFTLNGQRVRVTLEVMTDAATE